MGIFRKPRPAVREAIQISASIVVCFVAALNLIEQPVRLVTVLTLAAGIVSAAVAIIVAVKRRRKETEGK